MKTRYVVIVIIFIGVTGMLTIGIKVPPKHVKSIEVSDIHSISINNQKIVELTEEEIAFWKGLEFTLVDKAYPGETPDFVVDLIGQGTRHTAIYNVGSDIVFFSFVPEVEYGFLNAPPPGGWTKPLYGTKATEEILHIITGRTTRNN